ncbi:hypothetical protein PR202_gb05269 [Eleusine coracana subsp. coracana]|uniref:HMG box domain-containing protein n=1 Tax=Eleusine coracana subsp. coracana TaxID=191504 RepID=A0AAV5E6I4_ELECO|nr:hypothetical protein PR202_gb05269 [Eleusine coracana subsp. coracana]
MLAATDGPREDDSLRLPPHRKLLLAAVTASPVRPRALLAGREGLCLSRMKTRSQTVALGPKPLKTVALGPRPSSPKRKARPKPSGKGGLRAPKKPPTAFFYFMEDFRKTYQKENPSVKTMQEEKVKYYDIATEKRAEFEKALAEYNKKKNSGELSDESDDD